MVTICIPYDRLIETQGMMCDDFCHWAVVSADQDVLDRHCDECPLNKIRDDEFWEGKNARD